MYWHLQVNFQFLFFKKKNINFSIYISDNIKNGLETDIDCTMGKLTIKMYCLLIVLIWNIL